MSFETHEGVIALYTTLCVVWDRRVLLVRPAETARRRRGWTLPTARLRFGEHPQDVANRLLNDLGATRAHVEHLDIDSMVDDRGWRLGHHFRARVTADVTPGPDYVRHRWFAIDELPPPERFEGGGWERMLAARAVREVMSEG